MVISIHAPLRGATITTAAISPFSTISIHAPLRGATTATPRRPTEDEISIHAPLRGATLARRFASLATIFQSTLPCGERQQELTGDPQRDSISIHAPLRGATIFHGLLCFWRHNFNPRSPAGSDPGRALSYTFLILFQSTLPCGERPIMIWTGGSNLYFNPRSPAGSDGHCPDD